MFLTDEEKKMLAGECGPGIQRAMSLFYLARLLQQRFLLWITQKRMY